MKKTPWLALALVTGLAPVYLPALLYLYCRVMDHWADTVSAPGPLLGLAITLSYLLQQLGFVLLPLYLVFALLCVSAAIVFAVFHKRSRKIA
jgi:hypothetical protein